MTSFRCVLLLLFIAVVCLDTTQALDLGSAVVEKLPNGLTVMVLEEHALPVVSTQMLYKVGSRNECPGATGLAHYVEHMAFRATKNFPDSDVVSRIYAVGGEWHGYTWIDQTTYFETVPVQYLDLVLRIQADRMTSVKNDPDEFEAERGSVITELHSYENDPASVLYDAVLATAFQQHPYRYNVIGWISDVEKITHADIVDFYQRHYRPSNAVLAIAGDVNTKDVLERVRAYFGSIPASAPAPPVRTVEPVQTGERRITLHGTGPYNYFQISYQAPAARNPDYAAFLLLQALLTGSGGVNFEQRGSGEEARPGTRLHGIGQNLESFFQPTAATYAIDITGHIESKESTTAVEQAVETQMRRLRDEPVSPEELERIKEQVLTALVFDVETTENAAHQMAFFEGVEAFDVLLKLPGLVKAVTSQELQRAAQKYFQPVQRTVGWYLTDGKTSASLLTPTNHRAMARQVSVGQSRPVTRSLKNGTTVIAQRIDRTPTGFLRIVITSNNVEVSGSTTSDFPALGYTSIEYPFLRQYFARTVQQAAALWAKPFPSKEADPGERDNPESRLEAEIRDILGLSVRNGGNIPAVIAVSGDIPESEAIQLLESKFGSLPAPLKTKGAGSKLQLREKSKIVKLPGKPQSQLGYVVPAPSPKDPDSYAYRALLYVMSHGYEGRLGKDLISRKGLIYYIDSGYRTDGNNGWITMTAGVDREKLNSVRERFLAILNELKNIPPSEKELEEAKQHLIGRRLTGFQSNEELTGRHALEWIQFGRLQTQPEFEKNVNTVTMGKIRAVIPAFLEGAFVVVDTN